ncbi:MAG: ABC transporter ATP-binding protein [Nocardioidaceae bacterium]|nr:ABC transporter ATP-binding protein [Nocardioidaceae bacterium]
MAGTDAIRADAVSKTFTIGKESFQALGEVSLEIPERTFATFIGPSGCGKSTLLRILADVIAPTSGEVSVFGRSAAQAREERDFGFVFQDPVLLPWRSALANVELPMQLNGIDKAERRARALELLDLVGLQGFEKALPAKLSGGMARRVAIARALTLGPRVLFLDEPFNGLDEIRRQNMNAELQRIWLETRTTTVLVTHNVSEAVFLSDRVFVMGRNPGRIMAQLEIDLPRPRTIETMTSPEFVEYDRELTALLRTAYEDAEP